MTVRDDTLEAHIEEFEDMNKTPEAEQIEHWLHDQHDRNKFWGEAARLGMGKDEVHALFGVESMFDYKGGLGEALKFMNLWAGKLDAFSEEYDDTEETDFPPQDETYEPDPPKKQQDEAVGLQSADRTSSVSLHRLSAELPEAPALIWTKFIDRSGFTWSLTFRAGLPEEEAAEALRSLMRQMNLFRKAARAKDWLPATDGYGAYIPPKPKEKKTKAPPAPATAPAPPQTGPQRSADAPSSGEPGGDGDYPKGVSTLHSVKVDADGRVLFSVEGFRYPFKDSRGPDVVAGLFDPSLGWKPEHFTPGAKYEGLDLKCQWEKPDKYYDVVKVTG